MNARLAFGSSGCRSGVTRGRSATGAQRRRCDEAERRLPRAMKADFVPPGASRPVLPRPSAAPPVQLPQSAETALHRDLDMLFQDTGRESAHRRRHHGGTVAKDLQKLKESPLPAVIGWNQEAGWYAAKARPSRTCRWVVER